MTRNRAVLWIAVPALGLLLLGLAVMIRPDPRAPAKAAPKAAPPQRSPEKTTYEVARRAPPQKAAPASVVAGAVEEQRVRSTYKNYRTAVATGNEALQKVLLSALERDRDLAVRFAEEDLRHSADVAHQDITRRTLENLRR